MKSIRNAYAEGLAGRGEAGDGGAPCPGSPGGSGLETGCPGDGASRSCKLIQTAKTKYLTKTQEVITLLADLGFMLAL
jgi:hypothetical protein